MDNSLPPHVSRRARPSAAWLASILFIAAVAAPPPLRAAPNLTAVWANSGEDKVAQEELRASAGRNVLNSVWDGTRIAVFGARNETVAFNLVLEAGAAAASGVTVSFDRLDGPGGSSIASVPATGDGVFDWTRRPIELFYVRYLKVKGLSKMSYETYDERHIPRRMRRPWSGAGAGSGAWTDRPDHDRNYPDIAVPLEINPSFSIAAGTNQSVWADVYIPKTAAPGVYTGTLTVREGGNIAAAVPVQLTVYDFTLPDVPSAKTMLYYSSSNINKRYIGTSNVGPSSPSAPKARLLRDRHFLLAHRHRISLIGDDPNDCGAVADQPCPEWKPRLDGSLFTAANGYDGPGVNTGNNVYSIGTYGSWSWKSGGQTDMNRHTDAWANWFTANAPATDYFLYLVDESTETARTETWSQWILQNPGPGRSVRSMATIALPVATDQSPSLDIPTSTLGVGIPTQWQAPADASTTDARKRFYIYNGHRPATGSFAVEDDGVALRQLAWAQYKKRINRWFFWESTYYNNYQGGTGETDVFRSAQTFGAKSAVLDRVLGETGWNYSNGDGVLFYPGTDLVFPASSYGVTGPFASLRLKAWRRGIQDVEYLTRAAAVDPAQVQALVNQMVPKTLWEYGVTDPRDPTYVLTDVSWTDDPQAWEAARLKLANIIAPPASEMPTTPPPPPAGDGTPPAAPGSVYFNYPRTDGLRLNWNASSDDVGVAGYRVDVALDAGFTKMVSGYGDKDAGNNLWISLSGLQPGTAYFGRVRAYDGAGNLSGYGAAASAATLSADYAALSAPRNLLLGGATKTALTASWTAPGAGAFTVSSYQLQVSTQPSFGDFANRAWDGSFYSAQYTGATLTGLQPGTVYYARVRAIDSAGNTSNYGPAASAATASDAPQPLAPPSIAFRYPNVTTMRLSWDPPAGGASAAGYRMDLATDAGFSAKVAGYADKDVGNALSMNLEGLQAGTTYYGRVRTYDTQRNLSSNAAARGRTLNADYAWTNAPAYASFRGASRTTALLVWAASRSTGGFLAATYQVQVSRSATFSEFTANPWNGSFYASTSATLTGLQPGTRYYARVRALDVYGNASAYSPATSVLSLP
jgi:hypothetical protein